LTVSGHALPRHSLAQESSLGLKRASQPESAHDAGEADRAMKTGWVFHASRTGLYVVYVAAFAIGFPSGLYFLLTSPVNSYDGIVGVLGALAGVGIVILMFQNLRVNKMRNVSTSAWFYDDFFETSKGLGSRRRIGYTDVENVTLGVLPWPYTDRYGKQVFMSIKGEERPLVITSNPTNLALHLDLASWLTKKINPGQGH